MSVVCEKKTIYRTNISFVRKCHALHGLHQDGCRRRKDYCQSTGSCPLKWAIQTPLSTLHPGCPGAWSSCRGRTVTCRRWEHHPCQANGARLSAADWEHLSGLFYSAQLGFSCNEISGIKLMYFIEKVNFVSPQKALFKGTFDKKWTPHHCLLTMREGSEWSLVPSASQMLLSWSCTEKPVDRLGNIKRLGVLEWKLYFQKCV